jgi:hypothetical protein
MSEQNRQGSLTIADLEMIHAMKECQKNDYSETYYENKDIFNEIWQDVEAEDDLNPPNSNSTHRREGQRARRLSIPMDTSESIIDTQTKPMRGCVRRHSTFHSQERQQHYTAHRIMKDYLLSREDVHHDRRSSLVTNLMEFNLSYGVVFMTSTGSTTNNDDRPVSTSCPVLSYMNEDDEDSVELRRIKRPSLVSLFESKTIHDWETLEDDTVDVSTIEYVMDMTSPPIEESNLSRRKGKRRKPHSYQMLERRLSVESPVSVMKSLTRKEEMTKMFHPPSFSPVALSNATKDLDAMRHTGISNFPEQRVQNPIPVRQQCARGA